MGEDGSGLASVVSHLMTAAPESFDLLTEQLRAVIPALQRIRATRERVVKIRKKKVAIDDREVVYDQADEVSGDALRFDMDSEKDLPASQISDGTLIALAILTAVFQNTRLRLPDLHMAEDLKNTGQGNLFVIFGEPDIDILPVDDGQIQVRINGVDVFHPSSGEVRSSGPDGIACWLIDTDYNEESFFVRHA